MSKHAYLFMIVNNFKVLEKCFELIDDQRNDVYIHLDKKSIEKDRLDEIVKDCFKKSKVYFIERQDLRWADYSLVDAEIALLRAASNNDKYDYYHLLSESDLPIKNQDYIHDYFDKNIGKEFIDFKPPIKNKYYSTRYASYHLFARHQKMKNKLLENILKAIRKGLAFLQYLVKYDKTKKFNMEIKFGSQWFSITDSMARYIVKKEDLIKKMFNHSNCPDEHFLQTMVDSSEFKDNISMEGNLRYISWKGGGNSPKPIIIDDYEKIINSNNLFARKFSQEVDFDVVEKIYNFVKG